MNKILITILFLTLQMPLLAAEKTIEIPLGGLSNYAGDFSTVETDLKAKIIESAAIVCQGVENVALVGQVKIEFHLSALNLYDQDPHWIKGSYPRAGATVTVSCFDK